MESYNLCSQHERKHLYFYNRHGLPIGHCPRAALLQTRQCCKPNFFRYDSKYDTRNWEAQVNE